MSDTKTTQEIAPAIIEAINSQSSTIAEDTARMVLAGITSILATQATAKATKASDKDTEDKYAFTPEIIGMYLKSDTPVKVTNQAGSKATYTISPMPTAARENDLSRYLYLQARRTAVSAVNTAGRALQVTRQANLDIAKRDVTICEESIAKLKVEDTALQSIILTEDDSAKVGNAKVARKQVLANIASRTSELAQLQALLGTGNGKSEIVADGDSWLKLGTQGCYGHALAERAFIDACLDTFRSGMYSALAVADPEAASMNARIDEFNTASATIKAKAGIATGK